MLFWENLKQQPAHTPSCFLPPPVAGTWNRNSYALSPKVGAGIVPRNQTSKPGNMPIASVVLGGEKVCSGNGWGWVLLTVWMEKLNSIRVTLVWVTVSGWNDCLKLQLQEVNATCPWTVPPLQSGVTLVSKKASHLLPSCTSHPGISYMIIRMGYRSCVWWRGKVFCVPKLFVRLAFSSEGGKILHKLLPTSPCDF